LRRQRHGDLSRTQLGFGFRQFIVSCANDGRKGHLASSGSGRGHPVRPAWSQRGGDRLDFGVVVEPSSPNRHARRRGGGRRLLYHLPRQPGSPVAWRFCRVASCR
jgi:hypothetical protein